MMVSAIPQPEAQLLAKVPQDGSAIGNKNLRYQLGWGLEEYLRVRNLLVKSGTLRIGRGKGGSVSLKNPVSVPDISTATMPPKSEEHLEKHLYGPSLAGIKLWADDQEWDDHFVEQISESGKRTALGKWTVPDIVVVGVKKYDFTPSVVRDVITFEIKPSTCNVEAALQTASHTRCATKSYLFIPFVDGKPTEDVRERIERECDRFGVGLILASQLEDPTEWAYPLEPERQEPNPDDLEFFIETHVKNRGKLKKWLR